MGASYGSQKASKQGTDADLGADMYQHGGHACVWWRRQMGNGHMRSCSLLRLQLCQQVGLGADVYQHGAVCVHVVAPQDGEWAQEVVQFAAAVLRCDCDCAGGSTSMGAGATCVHLTGRAG